jgi:hypothetical protein
MSDIKTDETPKEEPKNDKGDIVSREAYEKALKEKKNAMLGIEEAKLKIAAYEAKLKEAEENNLKIKEDWKTLAETREKELLTLRQQLDGVKSETVTNYKLTAVKKEFEKMGADSKTLDFLIKNVNIAALKYDEDHKVVLGAEDEAKRIKEFVPQVFGKSQAGASHGAPELEAKSLTLESFKSMSLADKKKNMAELYKSQGINLKP